MVWLATCQVEYGPDTGYGLTTPLDLTLRTSHSMTLIDLTPGTTYHYRVTSSDAIGNSATSGDHDFTTSDIGAPMILYISDVTDITENMATIVWTTDEGATSQVEYDQTSQYDYTTIEDSTLVFSHSVNLTGLSDSSLYQFRVISKDRWGNEVVSADYTFSTLDLTSPVISNVAATTTTATSVTITWTTNEGATSHVEFGLMPSKWVNLRPRRRRLLPTWP